MDSPKKKNLSDPPSPPPAPNPPARVPLLEQLLRPETLQRLMFVGGGLLVLGFVGWLWSIGLFDQPIIAAVIIGATTLSVLAAGIVLVKKTRFELAGTGLTLLASLALPLNLWFYDAQGLITLADGGHLWIPAAMCCGIYAAVAQLLRKPMFVYAFVGGILLTGMLFLADHSVAHFWSLMPQVTFLVVVGWACILAELLFPSGNHEFSREQFGRAFLHSGYAVLTAGLAILFGGQVFSLLSFVPGWLELPRLANEPIQRAWALAIVAGSAGGFFVLAGMCKTRKSSFITGVLLASWSVFCFLDLIQVPLKAPVIATVSSLVVIGLSQLSRVRAVSGNNLSLIHI